MTARFIVGDVLEQLRLLPDASVDLVFSSPPFLALRSYLPPDHPDKGLEIGSEPTPGEFIDTLLDVTEECARVLAPHGSLCFELGDTYSGSGGSGGDYALGGLREGQERFDGSKSRAYGTGAAPRPARSQRRSRRRDQAIGIIPESQRKGRKAMDNLDGWPLDKSLCLIPEIYRLALSYGFNPLTGRQSDRWRVRNVVRWCRPNPPVGSLGDKVRPATSDIVIACKSRKRYFDLDAVRGNPEDVKDQRHRSTNGPKQGADPSVVLTANYHARVPSHPNGAPPLDHWWYDQLDQDAWLIPTAPYAGSHYATFPPALVVKPVLAMCPERVCVECGEPSRRLIEPRNEQAQGFTHSRSDPRGRTSTGPTVGGNETIGWSDCGHDDWRPGVVLDPFAGSGTVMAVASGHGRDSIGIDLDERNAELAMQRVGMFLSVEIPECVA